jgi:glutamine amidotransferase
MPSRLIQGFQESPQLKASSDGTEMKERNAISILDYGSGNIRSVQRALERVGLEVEVTSDFERAWESSGLVVPGVGAFGSCLNQLRTVRGDEVIRARFKSDRPILGICVGMQILFAGSEESNEEGLAILPNNINKIAAPILPHIGWNEVTEIAQLRILKGISAERFYFVHSYAAREVTGDAKSAISNYGEDFIAAIEMGPLCAVQFHPEKSGDVGLQLLKNWAETL